VKYMHASFSWRMFLSFFEINFFFLAKLNLPAIYVPLSRVRRLADLAILRPFPRDVIESKVDEDLLQEMKRLRTIERRTLAVHKKLMACVCFPFCVVASLWLMCCVLFFSFIYRNQNRHKYCNNNLEKKIHTIEWICEKEKESDCTYLPPVLLLICKSILRKQLLHDVLGGGGFKYIYYALPSPNKCLKSASASICGAVYVVVRRQILDSPISW